MKITLKVDGMHCRSCEMLIKDSLEETKGVIKSEVSHRDNTVKVDFDEKKISESKIKSIISGQGYKVR